MAKKVGYVDGFVVPVPKKNLTAYRKMAKLAGKVWREHGAISYTECVADDVSKGKVTSFPQSVKLKAGEIVVFSWVGYQNRTHRNRVNAKAMKDPRMAAMMSGEDLPFDGMRMTWGGFKPFISL